MPITERNCLVPVQPAKRSSTSNLDNGICNLRHSLYANLVKQQYTQVHQPAHKPNPALRIPVNARPEFQHPQPVMRQSP
eukprot:5761515-Amphidinium_carterae.1